MDMLWRSLIAILFVIAAVQVISGASNTCGFWPDKVQQNNLQGYYDVDSWSTWQKTQIDSAFDNLNAVCGTNWQSLPFYTTMACYSFLQAQYTDLANPCNNQGPPKPVCRKTCEQYFDAMNLLVEQDCHMIGGGVYPSTDVTTICAGFPDTDCIVGNARRTAGTALLAFTLAWAASLFTALLS